MKIHLTNSTQISSSVNASAVMFLWNGEDVEDHADVLSSIRMFPLIRGGGGGCVWLGGVCILSIG